MTALLLLLSPLFAPPARAQLPPVAPSTSAATAPISVPGLGVALDPKRGPWVIGEVSFIGNATMETGDLQSRVRARSGILYTPEDIDGDVGALMSTGFFLKVAPAVYAIPNRPVPAGFATIAVSTNAVRLVFAVFEKGTAMPAAPALPPPIASSTAPARQPLEPPPAAVSGVILTPTAYRGLGNFNRPGLGLDINAVYYIGRLYGKNSLPNTIEKTNYLDRIGLWLLSADGKMQLQSEGKYRPAVAAGGQGIFMFRDSPQPSFNTPTVKVTVSQKTTRLLSDAYLVASKKFWGVRASTGYMWGNAGEIVPNLSEFLSPQSIFTNGRSGCAGVAGCTTSATSKSVYFASLVYFPKPAYPLGIELFKPNGMLMNPWLLNFKLGYFLHLNFDVAYLKFQGGWDLLGNFQFRFNYFPSR